MTQSNDLPGRIARLERLLDGLEDARASAASTAREPSGDPGSSGLDRLREIAALLQERATRADCDEGDAIAMRALLEELASITANLRTIAADVEGRLDGVSAAVDEAQPRLKSLEEID